MPPPLPPASPARSTVPSLHAGVCCAFVELPLVVSMDGAMVAAAVALLLGAAVDTSTAAAAVAFLLEAERDSVARCWALLVAACAAALGNAEEVWAEGARSNRAVLDLCLRSRFFTETRLSRCCRLTISSLRSSDACLCNSRVSVMVAASSSGRAASDSCRCNGRGGGGGATGSSSVTSTGSTSAAVTGDDTSVAATSPALFCVSRSSRSPELRAI